MSKASVVEINGQSYSARGPSKAFSLPLGVIDGVTKKANPKPVARSLKHAAKRTASRSKKPAQTIHRRSEHSKTLIRSIVKQPTIASRKVADTTKSAANKYFQAINPARMSRAMAIDKHTKVQHFSKKPATKKLPYNQSKPLSGEVLTAAKADSQTSSSPLPVLPSLVTSASHRHLEKMLDEALTKADAHKKMLKSHLRRQRRIGPRFLPHWMNLLLAVLIVAVIGGFFIWQNVPQLSLKMAAMRAKISASLPSYTPAGFNFSGPIHYQDGSVTIDFKANADGARNYTMTQQATTMDSASLANNLPKDTPVQTSQIGGNTIYIYGSGNDATWVNNGIRYTIKDNANLDSDQLLKIANSL